MSGVSASGLGGDLLGAGSALQAVTALTEYLGGSTTTTSSSGNTNTQSSSNVSANESAAISQNTDQTTTTQTDESTNTDTTQTITNIINSLITNSASPAALAGLTNTGNQALTDSQTATANSSDPSKTQNIITSFIQQAGDALTAIFGQQNQAGLYNSASASTQANDVVSRATADAASAILGYQTSEQQIAATQLGIASTAFNQLAAATATQQTTADNVQTTNTDVAQQQDTTTTQDVNTAFSEAEVQSANTATTANSSAQTQSQSKSKTSASIICSYMFRHRMLQREKYELSSKLFSEMSIHAQLGYLMFATKMLRRIKSNPKSCKSRFLFWLFFHRTEHICARYGLGKVTFQGTVARLLLMIICIYHGLPFLLRDKVNQYFLSTQKRA